VSFTGRPTRVESQRYNRPIGRTSQMKAGKYNMNNNFSDKYEQIQKINKAYTNTD